MRGGFVSLDVEEEEPLFRCQQVPLTCVSIMLWVRSFLLENFRMRTPTNTSFSIKQFVAANGIGVLATTSNGVFCVNLNDPQLDLQGWHTCR